MSAIITKLSSPPRLTAVTFAALILMGTFLLMLPLSVKEGQHLHLVDALFTATSASCVTGLIVHDTGGFFSTFGQSVILVLIQCGGLGIMTLSIALPLMFGKSMGLSQRSLTLSLFDQSRFSNLPKLLRSIVYYTLTIESIGAISLSFRFYHYFPEVKKAIYLGVFHSISAFCNAGFSLFSNSLQDFRTDPWIMGTIMVLVVLGGLGFSILHLVLTLDLVFNFRRLFRKLTASMKLTLLWTGLLIAVPTVFFFFSEFVTGPGNSIWDKYNIAIFQTIAARTAGFQVLDLNEWSYASLFLYCIIMFIGGNPGGTAGGVKTTTVGVLLLSIRSMLFREKEIICFGRRVAKEDVTKSIAIVMLSFMTITCFMILLLSTENAPFHKIFFEVISAAGTVGASLGLTPELTSSGKLSISLLMLLGRIGPLTLALTLGHNTKLINARLPEDHFIVG